MLRPAKRPITLRHLLTHTAGFTYEFWDANTQRYVKATGTPSILSGEIAALRTPLAFDPGDRWLYGVSIDWVGRIVEATSGEPLDIYFRQHILGPLGMKDTGFATTQEQRARQASVHQRSSDGSLEPQPLETPFTPEFYAGGGWLYSTAPDYLNFLQMLLHGGSWNGARILHPETVAMMSSNQIGDIEAGVLKTFVPTRSNDVDFFPGAPLRWGLGSMINLQPVPDGRSANSQTWAGIYNTYYWIDPTRHLTGLFLTQVLPFADRACLRLYSEFERALYNGLKSV
jgi:CubicO group peptidase (beta-lactamase class C family)